MLIDRITMDIWELPAWRATGLDKGLQHEHQHLPFILRKGGRIRARAWAQDASAVRPAMRLYNDDERTEVVWDLTQQWTERTALADSIVLVNRWYAGQAIRGGMVLEYECSAQDVGLLPVFDAETSRHETFIAQWRNSEAPLAFFKARTVQMVIPQVDLERVANPAPLTNCHAIADFYDRMQSHFDHLCGLADGVHDSMNRNVPSRYLVKANRNGAGAAYFNSAHTAQSGPSMGDYLLDLPTQWLVAHEFAHGYQMNQMSDDVLSLSEVWNNIYAVLYQLEHLSREDFVAHSGLYWGDPAAMAGKLRALTSQKVALGDWGLFERLNFFLAIFMADKRYGPAQFISFNREYRFTHTTQQRILERLAEHAVLYSTPGERMDLSYYFRLCGAPLSADYQRLITTYGARLYLPLYQLIDDDRLQARWSQRLGCISTMELVSQEQFKPFTDAPEGRLTVTLSMRWPSSPEPVRKILLTNMTVYQQARYASTITFENVVVGLYRIQWSPTDDARKGFDIINEPVLIKPGEHVQLQLTIYPSPPTRAQLATERRCDIECKTDSGTQP